MQTSHALVSAFCEERTGRILRTVLEMEKDEALIWWIFDRIRGIPNFITHDPSKFTFESMLWCFLPTIKLYLIDDVGTALLQKHSKTVADIHITFWDKVLRGREQLCIAALRQITGEEHLSSLSTSIPLTSRATLAFAKRLGFKSISQPDSPVQHLVWLVPDYTV